MGRSLESVLGAIAARRRRSIKRRGQELIVNTRDEMLRQFEASAVRGEKVIIVAREGDAPVMGERTFVGTPSLRGDRRRTLWLETDGALVGISADRLLKITPTRAGPILRETQPTLA